MIKSNSFKISILFFGIFLSIIPDILNLNNGFTSDEKLVIRMLILMIFCWLTEIIPISITALLPILFSPFFLEIKFTEILSQYASSVVFLLLGGFILAQGFEKSQLHRRIALKTLLEFGKTRKRIIFIIMLSSAFFSMWLSNTATCLLMLPIVKNILDSNFNTSDDNEFSKFLILSIAYASSIGGMATPIGTIPNAIMIGFLKENHNIEIDFVQWFTFGFPLVLILLFLLFGYLGLKFENKNVDRRFIRKKFQELGNFSFKEKVTVFILTLTLSLWILKNTLNEAFGIYLNDAVIAIFGSFLFFIIPIKKSNFILSSDWYRNIPWNVLILFGGGLSMASLITSTGLANEFSKIFYFFNSFKLLTLIFIIAIITSFLTEFTSNTATTFLLLPILSIFALNNNMDVINLTLPFILAASCAFMMPIATPPNAIVYSSNKFKISFMASNGFLINLISVTIISLYVYFFNNF